MMVERDGDAADSELRADAVGEEGSATPGGEAAAEEGAAEGGAAEAEANDAAGVTGSDAAGVSKGDAKGAKVEPAWSRPRPSQRPRSSQRLLLSESRPFHQRPSPHRALGRK